MQQRCEEIAVGKLQNTVFIFAHDCLLFQDLFFFFLQSENSHDPVFRCMMDIVVTAYKVCVDDLCVLLHSFKVLKLDFLSDALFFHLV